MKIFSNPEYLIKLLPFSGSCNALLLLTNQKSREL